MMGVSKDLLILPGGNNWKDQLHKPILEKVGLDKGVIIVAICDAVDALANFGYLDTRKHTSNSLGYTKCRVQIIRAKNFLK